MTTIIQQRVGGGECKECSTRACTKSRDDCSRWLRSVKRIEGSVETKMRKKERRVLGGEKRLLVNWYADLQQERERGGRDIRHLN